MNPTPAPAPAPAPGPAGDARQNSAQNERPYSPRSPRRFERGNRPPGGRSGPRPGSATRRIQRILRRPASSPSRVNRTADYFPEPAGPTTVRILPLGGVEEVGQYGPLL